MATVKRFATEALTHSRHNYRQGDRYGYFIDGDGGLGYAPTMLATEKTIKKPKKRHCRWGRRCIGHYGSGALLATRHEEGCTAYSVQGAYPQYYGSNGGKRAAHYGNPPLCFGFPGQEEAPVILDGATCILADYQRGEEFEALESQIPAAFFKSMGYTAIGTLLGGAFVGQADPRADEVAAMAQSPFRGLSCRHGLRAICSSQSGSTRRRPAQSARQQKR